MPVPRVTVRKSVRNPIRPRLGTTKSIRTQPAAWFVISSMRPLRAAISCVIAPTNSSGQSIVIASNGSCSLPSMMRVTTCGLSNVNSKPPRAPLSTHTATASYAAPLLNQYRQCELAAALHLPGVRPVDVHDPDRHVADQFLVETAAHHPRG